MIKRFTQFIFVFAGLAMVSCEPYESEVISPKADLAENIPSSFSTSVSENNMCSEAYIIPLNYDGGTTGNVSISNDDLNLSVTISSTNGFQNVSNNVALWVGTDLADLPKNNFGIPLDIETSFDYLAQAAGTEYTFIVPLANISGYNTETCGVESLFVVTSVKAVIVVNNLPALLTAYGGNSMVDTSFPWWYDTYTPSCCEQVIEGSCETAYAKFPVSGDFGNGYIFATNDKANPDSHSSLNLTNNQWGWGGRFIEDGEYEFDIWGGAALNDTRKGTLVGTLKVSVDGNDVKVSYDIDPGFGMSELHIFVGSSAPSTTAPGQYGYTREFDSYVTSHIADFTIDGERAVWIVAHAVVCGAYPENK
jgi:hypothetical protein